MSQLGVVMTFSWDEARAELERRRQFAYQLGGADAVARLHAAGKLTIRERIDHLADPGSLTEIGTLAQYRVIDAEGRPGQPNPSSFVCGLAKVDGRDVAVGGEDWTSGGGIATLIYLDRSKGEVGGFIEDLAHEYRIPLLMCIEGVGGGVAVQQNKGHATLVSTARWRRSFELMGEVPVLSAVVGLTAGGAAARAVMSHFSVMTRANAAIFASGPPLVRRALGIEIDKFALGGASVAATVGTIDNIAEDDNDALRQLKHVLSYLPQNAWELPPVTVTGDPVDRSCDELLKVFPTNRRRMYDPRDIIEVVVDRGSFFEVGTHWGRTVVQGFARIGGQPVGVFSNSPMHLGGALDGAGSEKQLRFMELCDTFHLPVIYFVDVPGFMIGPDAERDSVLRKGARAMQVMSELRVPVVTVHTRKAYGMAVNTTNAAEGLCLRLAWPTAEWGDMPPEGTVEAAFRRQIAAAPDPEAYRTRVEERLRAEGSPWLTAEAFGVEEMIDPAETRYYIARFLEACQGALKLQLGPRIRTGPRV
jgi:acetyl-CoA carboxylase carboxyltransferase component